MHNYQVAIITKMSKNYGAVLQAFALKRSIENLGYTSYIINYNGAVGNDTYHLYKRGFGLLTLRYNIKRFQHRKGLKKSIKKFQDFRLNYFKLTTTTGTYSYS